MPLIAPTNAMAPLWLSIADSEKETIYIREKENFSKSLKQSRTALLIFLRLSVCMPLQLSP
jgi:hypothetical protein